jgi:mannan endo-1,4-beta-mannosidase
MAATRTSRSRTSRFSTRAAGALRARCARVATVLTLLVAMATAGVARGADAHAAPAGFVVRDGQHLMLDGRPYLFTGANIYNANSVNNYWYTLGTGDGLDRALRDLGPGTNVIRAWFGQWLANPTGSGIDWTVFDHTLSTARAHGYKVIVTFGDQDGTWDDGVSKTLDSQWYQFGYASQVSRHVSPWGARNSMTYRDFVSAVVARYKSDPTVLMWQLMNEAETKRSDGSCSSATDDAGAMVLRRFADSMGATIKRIDPHHLLTLGTIGTGQCGTSGDRFRTVYASKYLDLTEMHDYVASENIIGDRWNGMALRLEQSRSLNKPLFVGELGIDPQEVGGLSARAERVAQKLAAQFAAGVVGVVAWEWRNAGETDGDRFLFGPGDPMLDSLRLSRYGP